MSMHRLRGMPILLQSGEYRELDAIVCRIAT